MPYKGRHRRRNVWLNIVAMITLLVVGAAIGVYVTFLALTP